MNNMELQKVTQWLSKVDYKKMVSFVNHKVAVQSIIFLLILGNIVLVGVIVTGDKDPKKDIPLRGKREESAYVSGTSPSGSVYTRWGRTTCPGDTELVYSGVAGGGQYNDQGSGSNYLCLPLDPIFGKVIPGVQNFATVHGAEYQTGTHSFDTFSNQNAEVLHNHNVPCAVCQSNGRASMVMIPARNECYEGWFMEYDGYLMATLHNFKGRTEFVCMDHDPEADKSGFRNEDGALFYTTEGVCGSLPCPPYANEKELTCVVCTK